MSRIEQGVGGHGNIHAVDRHVMLPQRIVARQPGIEIVGRFSPASFPPDAVPEEVVEPYVGIPLHRVKDLDIPRLATPAYFPSYSIRQINIFEAQRVEVTQQEAQQDVQKETVPTFSLNLLVVTADNPADNTIYRQVNRGVQRGKQYKDLIKLIRNLDDQLTRGEMPTYHFNYREGNETCVVSITVDEPIVEKLRSVAGSFYEDELKSEPLTDQLAKDASEEATAESSLIADVNKQFMDSKFEAMRKNGTGITVTYQKVSVKGSQSSKKAKAEQTVKEEKEPEEERDLATEKLVEEAEQLLIDPAARILIWQAEQIILDKPSKGAGNYVRELMERPF